MATLSLVSGWWSVSQTTVSQTVWPFLRCSRCSGRPAQAGRTASQTANAQHFLPSAKDTVVNLGGIDVADGRHYTRERDGC
jgi:hypothetical protein